MDFFIRIMAEVSVGDYQLESPDNRAEKGVLNGPLDYFALNHPRAK